MLIVLSPAKRLDLEGKVLDAQFTQPKFLAESKKLVKELRRLDAGQLSALMRVSEKTGELNFDRYAAWKTPFTSSNARPSIYAFKGDVYLGLGIDAFAPEDVQYAQDHLRILSGLYGVLRPLDLMQPYRLEMGTAFRNAAGHDLYAFWGDKITRSINGELAKQGHKILVNLASNEYFKAVNQRLLRAQVITPVFRDYNRGEYRVISFFAKKARGMMAAYIIRNRIEDSAALQGFNTAGYRYSKELSEENRPAFIRRQQE